MRLEQLVYLQSIKQTGSMNKTGENLHISQQAISTAVRLLEQELGAQLLVRTSKGVWLTADGERVVSAADDVFARLERLRSEVGAGAGHAKEEVALLVHAGMLRSLLPRLVEALYEAFADCQLKIISAQLHDILKQLASGQAQLGLVYVAKDDLSEIGRMGLDFHRLGMYRLGAFMNRQSALADCDKVSLAEVLARYPVMIFEEVGSENNMACQFIAKYHLQEQARYLAVSDEVFAQMLEKDRAISIGFQSQQDRMMENRYEMGVFVPFVENETVYSGYMAQRAAANPLILERFQKILRLALD